jgi:hypothetical protein
MKSKFAIFGLERIPKPDADDEKSGQPFLFRKYPEQFESAESAHEELEIIMEGKSPFSHFIFDKYAILEIYSKKS